MSGLAKLAGAFVAAAMTTATVGCDSSDEPRPGVTHSRRGEAGLPADQPARSASSPPTTAGPSGRPRGAPGTLEVVPPDLPAKHDAKVEVIGEGFEGCKLLGADDENVYLSKGLLGGKRLVTVTMTGATSEPKLAEPIMAQRFHGGFVLGCAGKAVGHLPCEVVRARPVDGSAVEHLGQRGKIVAGGIVIEGDTLWTLELTEGGATELVAGPVAGGERRVVSVTRPMHFDVRGDSLVVASGQEARNGKLQRLERTGSTTDLLTGAMTAYPMIDGDWLYYRDNRFRLVRIRMTGGAPEPVLGPMGRTFGIVSTPSFVVWLEAKDVDGKLVPVLKRLHKPPA
jgi:hypothetical protein